MTYRGKVLVYDIQRGKSLEHLGAYLKTDSTNYTLVLSPETLAKNLAIADYKDKEVEIEGETIGDLFLVCETIREI